MERSGKKIKATYMAESILELKSYPSNCVQDSELQYELLKAYENQVPLNKVTRLRCNDLARNIYNEAEDGEEEGDEEKAFLYYHKYTKLFNMYVNALPNQELCELQNPKSFLNYYRFEYCEKMASDLSMSLDKRYARLRNREEIIREVITKKRKEVKMAKMARKECKNVKNITVTQGVAEEYNIDEILKELGEDEPNGKSDGKVQKQKKKKGKRKEKITENNSQSSLPVITNAVEELSIDSVPTNDPILEEQESLASQVPSLNPSNSNNDENKKDNTVIIDNHQEPEQECSICYHPRTKTFLFYPCGHATFCELCANRILDELKKCPTCQSPIQGTCPVFL